MKNLIKTSNGKAIKAEGNVSTAAEQSSTQATEGEYNFTLKTETLKTIAKCNDPGVKMRWASIRDLIINENLCEEEKLTAKAKLSGEDFDIKRVVTLTYAKSSSERNSKKVPSALLVSFIDETLSKCTGQLAFRILREPNKTAKGASLTYWPNKPTKSLQSVAEYISKKGSEIGYPPLECKARDLIVTCAEIFLNLWNKDNKFDDKTLRERFVEKLNLMVVDLVSPKLEKMPEIYIQNLIETDENERNVHMYVYEQKLSDSSQDTDRSSVIRLRRVVVVLEIENRNSDGFVCWTLGTSQQVDKGGPNGQFVVWARRAPPGDEDKGKYHGFVRTSPRKLMLEVRNLIIGSKLISSVIRQQNWIKELFCVMINTFDHYFYGPRTLESVSIDDQSGENKSATSRNPTKGKTVDKSVQHQVPFIAGFLSRHVDIRLEESELCSDMMDRKYDKLLRRIVDEYGLSEKCKERMQVKLYRRPQDATLLVKFFNLQGQEPEVSFTIRTDEDGGKHKRMLIDRYKGGAGEKFDLFAHETISSVWGLLKWCVMAHQWVLACGVEKNTSNSMIFVEELIETQRLLPASHRTLLA